jgi:hypothetical protein
MGLGVREDDVRRFVVNGSGNPLATDKSLKDMLDAIAGSGFATGTDSLKVLSDVLDLIRTELTFQHQPDAHLVQLNPVQNTWYTILDTTLNCRLYSVSVLVWGTNETLEVRVTIDGEVLSGSLAATHTTYYYVHALLYAAGFAIDGNAFLIGNYTPFEGRSIKVEVRKTTAAGTGTLEGYAVHAKR